MLKNRFLISRKYSGFTLVEMLIVMGLSAILLMLSSVNLTNLIPKASTVGSEEVIIADLKYQQQKAMIGETEGRSSSDRYGIYFDQSIYTLFHGDAYNSVDLANSDQDLGEAIILQTTFPNNSVIFEKGSGEIVNFVEGQNTISIIHSTGETRTISLNNLGVVIDD